MAKQSKSARDDCSAGSSAWNLETNDRYQAELFWAKHCGERYAESEGYQHNYYVQGMQLHYDESWATMADDLISCVFPAVGISQLSATLVLGALWPQVRRREHYVIKFGCITPETIHAAYSRKCAVASFDSDQWSPCKRFYFANKPIRSHEAVPLEPATPTAT
jgi:hypothetical protein